MVSASQNENNSHIFSFLNYRNSKYYKISKLVNFVFEKIIKLRDSISYQIFSYNDFSREKEIN